MISRLQPTVHPAFTGAKVILRAKGDAFAEYKAALMESIQLDAPQISSEEIEKMQKKANNLLEKQKKKVMKNPDVQGVERLKRLELLQSQLEVNKPLNPERLKVMPIDYKVDTYFDSNKLITELVIEYDGYKYNNALIKMVKDLNKRVTSFDKPFTFVGRFITRR